jgi:ABC-type lipoprotein export system ATPase subunit
VDEPVLAMNEVCKSFQDGAQTVWACRDVDLSVALGEVVVIEGPSGAGKSTLLMVAAGLIEADAGRVVVEGQGVTGRSERGRAGVRLESLGVVHQEYLLVEEFDATENVMLPLEARRWPADAARQEAARCLDLVGLDGLGARRPHQLSGGQRQRVGIARAIAGNKRLLLADEPTGALDSQTSAAVFGVLRTIADRGAAVVLASHNPQSLLIADRVCHMQDGSLDLKLDPKRE